MNLHQRIKAFATLGNYLTHLPDPDLIDIASRARNENPWFTPESVRTAITGICTFLREEALSRWLSRYPAPQASKTVALVMAGNIPLVGFHDLLSVLIMGHRAMIKLSSKDKVLPEFLITKIISIEPAFSDRIQVREQIRDFDAVIATGSDNSARYFEYYFGKYPNIIRKNRSSVAILSGNESEEEYTDLGRDVFTYFGLGCRNVSKLFVPAGFNFDKLFRSWEPYAPIIHHHKYCNNYDYQKSILLVNRHDFLDNGFVILQKSDRFVSPISVVYYDTYSGQDDLRGKIEASREKIQVIVGKHEYCDTDFGTAQYPGVEDYADKVDTLDFLARI